MEVQLADNAVLRRALLTLSTVVALLPVLALYICADLALVVGQPPPGGSVALPVVLSMLGDVTSTYLFLPHINQVFGAFFGLNRPEAGLLEKLAKFIKCENM